MYILNTSFICFRWRNDVVSSWSEAATQSFSFNLFPSHTRWIINTLSRPVHMSYIHAGIDRHNCTHMRSSAFSSIRSHSKVKDFLENSDKRNVFIRPSWKQILKITGIKSEGDSANIWRVFHSGRNFSSLFYKAWENKLEGRVCVSAAQENKISCLGVGLMSASRSRTRMPRPVELGGGGSARVQVHSH